MVKFKQLDDFMLITGKPLKRLAMQLFNRFPTDNKLEEVGITMKNGFYEIPYIHIKQEMDRLYHESLIVTDIILDWEKNIVNQINEDEKKRLIDTAKQNNNGYKAHINFSIICNYAGLQADEIKLLSKLRNHALHAKIPEKDWA